ncbi:PilZ domain-containing protein [Pseudomonas sp. TMP25]|uniref:PilZ domain-containing protein n=1 Tax=Pseudomonas sp. TMP25 TaxID=3136561 RepID=UPI003101380E
MQEQALLTPAELAFIRQLNGPVTTEPLSEPRPQTNNIIGQQLSELLSNCTANQQLSLHAHIANQRLTFDLHLSQSGKSLPNLQLSAPHIFDEGEIDRAWRSPLPEPLRLQMRNAKPSHLLIHQLSMNGALIEHRAQYKAPKRFNLLLALNEHTAIALTGVFVRETANGLLAYQLNALDSQSGELLRAFIYQQHRLQEQRSNAAHKNT